MREEIEYLMLEHRPTDSRLKIKEDGICQTLTSRMGTGGGNIPLVLIYVKSRRAQSKDDYETWKESNVASTLNLFDTGGGHKDNNADSKE